MNTFLARAGSNSRADASFLTHYHVGVCNLGGGGGGGACARSAPSRSATVKSNHWIDLFIIWWIIRSIIINVKGCGLYLLSSLSSSNFRNICTFPFKSYTVLYLHSMPFVHN